MHKSEIPEEVRRPVSLQRGRLNRWDSLTPARTARLVGVVPVRGETR